MHLVMNIDGCHAQCLGVTGPHLFGRKGVDVLATGT